MTFLGDRMYVVSMFAVQVLIQPPSQFVGKCILEEYISYRQDLHFPAVMYEKEPPISNFHFLPGIFCK